MKRYTALFLFVVLMVSAKAQDLIITKKDFKINCKIVKDDSLSLFYRIPNHPTDLEIKKTDVKEYYYNLIRQKQKKVVAPPSSAAISSGKKEIVLVGVSTGIGIPLGEFASQDINSDAAGLAKPGFLIRGSLVIKLAQSLGLSAGYHLQRNPIASDLINTAIQNVNGGVPFTTESTPWSAGGFFAGLYLEQYVTKTKNVSLYVNAMLGGMKYKSPEVVSTVAIPGVYFKATQGADEDRGLGYLFNAGLRAKINPDASMHFGLAYFGGKANFNNVRISNSQGYQGRAIFNQSFSILNLEVGLVIAIGK